MKTNSRWTIYRWIYRMLYLFGLILLLTGMMLSLISSPAQAGDPRTVAETATIEPPFDRQPVPKRPVQQKGNPNLSQPKVRIESAGQPSPQENLSPLSEQIGLPPGTGSVRFLTPDTAICRMGPGTLEATVEVSLPPGVSAILQTSYRIVEPSDLSTDSVFSTTTVENGDTVTISGDWPGVRPGDTVVEIHFGAILLDPTTRNPISDGAGVDFYWYPWNCDLPTTPPTVIVEETSTATPTATATATVPGPTVEVGATATPTVTDIASTDTPTATPTATATITVEQTATATFTATATDTPPTLAVGDTSTPTITATMTPTLTGCCATRTRTASPPTVEVGETATSTPPPTLTPQGPTAVSPSQIATIAATSAPSATSQFPTPIVIVVTATSGVPVTGEQQATAVLDFEATLTAQAEPLQAPPAGEQALVPVTGADLAHRPLTVASLPFWQRLSTYMGLFMLGIGLVLQGLAKRSE